jgi:hypothetical protein
MTPNEFFQMQSIAMIMAFLCFIAVKLEQMDYGFFKIAIGIILYFYHGWLFGQWYRRYIQPADWLAKNHIYLWYVLLSVGEFFFLFGLLEQLRLHQVEDKSFVWFVGSPIVTVASMGICAYYESRASVKLHIIKKRHH